MKQQIGLRMLDQMEAAYKMGRMDLFHLFLDAALRLTGAKCVSEIDPERSARMDARRGDGN